MASKYTINNPEGIYFITFATVEWVDVFSRAIYKDIVIESLRYCQDKKGLILHAYVIMSNHVHLIASAKNGYHLSDILRDMKKYTSKQILKTIQASTIESRKRWMIWLFKTHGEENSNNVSFQFWQQDNHPIELSTNQMQEQRLEYIHQNPVKAGIVYQSRHYVYSSAASYAGEVGLLELVFLE
ncbi:transposase [marine bacterium AO1-C]|nr:transposase [marine bacterium AO1-C]